MTVDTIAPTRDIATFLSSLRYEDLPQEVVERTKELFVDWVASALAGKNARPVCVLERFSGAMGPADGPCEILPSRQRTSPLFAALVNGAASHVVEQDDVHNAGLFHPGAVVFPAALATAQETGASGKDFLTAAVAGYEMGKRAGSYLGRSHYKVFHTTGTAGTLAAAAATSHLLGANEKIMLHAFGSAGTQAAGLWEFLQEAADSKQLHTAKAAADGLLAAYIARDGFTGATHILEGEQGMAAGMSSNVNPAKLVEGLGDKWATLETSFKFHASCRHTHPAADALLQAMEEHSLRAEEVAHVRARVHEAAIDVLGPVTDPQTIHQSKFSMGFVLALIALHGRAGVTEFSEEALRNTKVRKFLGKVEMVYDPEVETDTGNSNCWVGLVEVETTRGERFTSRIDIPRGDPGNTLSRDEIEDKAHRLASFQEGASTKEIATIINRVWKLDQEPNVRSLLLGGECDC